MTNEERKIHEEYERRKAIHDARIHDEIMLGTMDVTDVIVELCAGYTREGFTIEEKRYNKLMARLCDAYDGDVRTIEKQRERITELSVALHDEQHKTLIERITGRRWRK